MCFDRADYNNDPATTSGITVNMAAGTVVGDTTIGTDTLRSIEAVRGTNFADTYVATGFSGTSINAGSNGTFNEFTGNGGDDIITGNGNTRISYNNASAAVTVNLATGIAQGTAAGDIANVGHDTFTGVNAIMGSMFDDTLTGSGNTASTETFTGLAGNDFIDGAGGFDISSYNNIYFSTGPVTVNMGAGTATGDASIGSDTLRSIEGIQGTNFADAYDASTFGTAGALNIGNNGTFNQFEGLGGNDTITGNGNTRVIYSSATAGVTINLAAGTATGDVSVGTDNFTAVNSATGSSFADIYNATGFVGGVGAFNSGSFNLFEGLGGNDTITGNGNTRIAYTQAAAPVTVDLSLGTAHGTAAGDAAGVGTDTDTIIGGVNSVQGSNFADTLIGGGGNELFFGGSGNDSISAGGGNDQITGGIGNDTIDGGAGTDVAIYTGPTSAYTITSPGAGQTQVADSVTTRDGTDILTNVELLQFTDSTVMLTSGSASAPVDISSIGFGAANTPLTGTAGDDYLMVGGNAFGHQINLGAGNDTVALAPGGGFFQLNLVNVENVVGSAGDDNITLVNNANGLAIDLGAGNNSVTLANGVNSVNATNVQNISSSDFTGAPSDDTLTLLNDVTGMSVNLAQGNNTLDLAAGTNIFADIFNVQHINGTASDDNLTVTDTIFESGQNPIIDLGAGNNTLTFGAQFDQFTALNVQHIVGTASDGGLTLNNDVSGVDVSLGGGTDNLTLAAGTDSVSIHNIANIGFNDFAPGMSSDDSLTLLNDVSGVSANGGNGENTLDLAAGSNSFTGLFNFQHINGTASDDTLTVSQIGATDAIHVDLGAGDNTLNLDAPGGATLDLANVQHLNGDAGDSFVELLSDVNGLAVDLGAGNDTLTLANGTNSIGLTNVENVNGSDFTGGINPSDDTLNLLNDVTGVSFNLGDGDNTINLAAGTNSVDNLFNINQVNGTASDDVLTVTQQSSNTVFDMGAGNDTIIFGSTANGVTVNNAETITGSDGNDTITANSTSGVTSIAGGMGADTITIGSGAAAIDFASAAESSVGNGDTVVNFNAASDTFTFSGMAGGPNGLTGPIQFLGSAAFDGSAGAPHSEARIDTTGGQTTLQIDVNGDGQFGANDIEIHLANLAGTLHNANFMLV